MESWRQVVTHVEYPLRLGRSADNVLLALALPDAVVELALPVTLPVPMAVPVTLPVIEVDDCAHDSRGRNSIDKESGKCIMVGEMKEIF